MKKNILIMTSLLFISLNGFSITSSCEEDIHAFGDGSGKSKDFIPEDCIEIVKRNVGFKKIKKSLDEKILIYGYKNLIVIEDPNTKMKGQNVIAGKYTELNHIESLFLDEHHKEIVVLEKTGDILFFSSVVTGNVAPIRVIKNKELEGSVDIVVNSKNGELIVLNKEKKEIQFYKRTANIHAPENKKNVEMLRVVENIKGDYLKFDNEKQEIYSIDPENKLTTTIILEKNLK